MKRRDLLRGLAAVPAAASLHGGRNNCGCELAPAAALTQPDPLAAVASGLKITGVKTFGVSLPGDSDRPYVFVKIETNQGLVGWGESTLEGKAGAALACVNDFRDFLIGKDPMAVEHHWQSLYVHSFYRAGPVIGSAISGIDQALWDIRGKALGVPVYKLLGGPLDSRGVRGYYHARATNREELTRLRESAAAQGVTCFKTGPGDLFEFVETHAKIDRTVKAIGMMREVLGPEIDIAIDMHAKTNPTVASVILKELEPFNLLFVEEPCPPENPEAMARIARRTTVPIATGERLVASYGCRALIENAVIDILQTDINHVGGITALWKVASMAGFSNISMAPHACEGPIGGIATLHVDAAIENFLIQEICGTFQADAKDKIWEEWLGFPAMRMRDGRFPLPEKPGLGFELSEAALAKYPFAGTRPMARVFHPDGSVAEW